MSEQSPFIQRAEAGYSHIEPTDLIEGFVDFVTWEHVKGWAWCPAKPNIRLVVEVVSDGRLIGTAVAEELRTDLAASGKGDGLHGFTVHIRKAMFWHLDAVISVREQVTQAELDQSPITLRNDDALLESVTSSVVEGLTAKVLRSGSTESMRHHASLLLQQFDRLLSEVVSRSRIDTSTRQEWIDLCVNRPTEGLVKGLIDVVKERYGDKTLEVPQALQPTLSIVIPVHNQFSFTYGCLKSITDCNVEVPIEVIVVDDASTDETLLSSLLISGVHWLRNPRNIGFVRSVMAGVERSVGRYIMLLNNDTIVHSRALENLVSTLDGDPSIGVAGAKLLFADGSLQECGGIVWRDGDAWNYGRNDNPGRPEYCYMRDADYVSGAALVTTRAVWDEVQGLSSEFEPGYYEDTDYCFKVREAGLRVVVQPTAVVTHFEGATAGINTSGTSMKRFQVINSRKFEKKWRRQLLSHSSGGVDFVRSEAQRGVTRRILFIDDSVLTPDRDAGSVSMIRHMIAFSRMKFQVHFVPAHNMARIDPYTRDLERMGVWCHYQPYVRSAEEVLKAIPEPFDIVYVHRVSNAAYIPVIRALRPTSLVLYNVADLHHIRLGREAALSQDPSVAVKAVVIKEAEFIAVRQADVTIVPSSSELNYLGREVPGARVALIPWPVEPRPTAKAFTDRFGLAFVGSNHGPNIDGINWFLDYVYGEVVSVIPNISLSLFGTHACDGNLRLKVERFNRLFGNSELVKLFGVVGDLDKALSLMRLTIAPLRYGAGLKGKMLESFALGLPCVMTAIASEGAGLSAPLQELVVTEPSEFARLVIRLHEDEEANTRAAEEGLRYVSENFSSDRIESLLDCAIQKR